MAENIQRSKGRASNYKLDRGGTPSDPGPFIGEVRNNVDPTRSGRLQVLIEEFVGENRDDSSLWRTVSYLPPFYGITEHSGSDANEGDYVGNRHSYGMWFTPPDIGTRVLCFFANGDPNQGYYIGCIPEPGLTHMVPAIGSSENVKRNNAEQDRLLKNATRLPVTEINNENIEINENPRFFDQPKPVHSYAAGVIFQQGLIDDRVRGTIGSNSQRESPSSVYGVSTPGRPIFQSGLGESDVKQKLEKGEVKRDQVKVIGRRGGHSIVLDDGDIEGNDQLVRIRTSRGHQILMSDDGDCVYVIHANGQSWVELGKEGTVDVFAVNSVNVRTQGQLNLHADKNINIYSGDSVNIAAKNKVQIESEGPTNIISKGAMKIHSKAPLGILTNAGLAVKADGSAAISSTSGMSITGSRIDLNSGSAASVPPPQKLKKVKLPDVEFSEAEGWKERAGKIETIVDRAPTHEPYPYHNQGTDNKVEMAPPAPPPPRETPVETQVALSSVGEKEVTAPIEVQDFASQAKASAPVGPISVDQVTGMMAQRAKEVNQAIDEIKIDEVADTISIGKFGFGIEQLESAGFLKPGMVDTMVSSVSEIPDILSSATVWTGKEGISSITELLAAESIQDTIQGEVIGQAYEYLSASGVFDTFNQVQDVAGMVQAAASQGPEVVAAWANGQIESVVSGTATQVQAVVDQITDTARQAQYAVNFVSTKVPETLATAAPKAGHIGTVSREALDATVTNIIGNAKVPAVVYQASETATSTFDTLASRIRNIL